MKRLFPLLVLILLAVFSCSKRSDVVKLKDGTPSYQLAKDIASVIPSFDPDKNAILVKSDNFDISIGEVIKNIRLNFGNKAGQLKSLDAERLKMIITRNARELGEQRLLMTAAENAGVKIPQTEIDSVLNLQYSSAGGEEKYIEQLKTNDISIERVKTGIETGLTINRYLEEILAFETDVSEEEIEAEYQKEKTATVRHILMLTQGKSDSAKENIYKQMESILKMAKSGEDFTQLAKQYSEDPGSKERGGLYENFGRGQMVKPFEDAAFTVPVGEVSDIVETRYGYHILKVINRKKESRPYEEVKSQLESTLSQNKRADAFQDHLAKLKFEASFELVEL